MNNKNHVELPVHFFTIVLNGKPFIEYHINVFKQLPFKWHWHIIEGVADLINDTAWSLQNGARISGELHNNGLSNDGTSEYLDNLQKEFPDNVTVYRKGGGRFWNGKLEMVNAPLQNINSECILWEIDSDELWTAEQFIKGRQLYLNNPSKTASFYFCFFFVGENKFITSVNTYGNHTDFEWLRTWRFIPGDKWISHEPPTLCRLNENGEWINIGRINPFTHSVTQHHKLVFQHYAYVTPEQLKFKEQYYGYKNALTQWEQLQKLSNLPLLLKHYFEWVKDETIVDDSRKYGIIPLAVNNGKNWKFNYPPEEKNSVKKILFVRTDSIGDCIISASMLEPIKNKYKDAQVDVVCQDKTSIVFKNSPFVNKVIDYNRDRIRNDKLYKDSILSLLRNENYDVVLNTVFSREDVTDIISLGSGAKKIIGLNGDSCNISPEQLLINNQFYNLLITIPPGLTELQNHKMFLNELGIDAGNLNPVIWHDEYSENFAEEFFQKNNLKKENTVALFPFAQHIHKEYPNYEEIIKHYQQFTFLIFGGNEKINDDKLKVWASNKNCINLVGKTTVLQMSSLIKRCGLYVGADSAGVHVACANNIKNVVILGGGHFGRFLPYSKFTSAVVKPMECYSCNWNCKYSRVKCVWDIDADLVIYAIDKTMFQNFDKPSVFFKYENDEQHSIIKQYIDAEKVNVFELQQYGNKNQNIIIKKELPKISIVTPNYNQETFLEQTILSVLEQNYPNLEYIIMDGGSTDRSIDIIKKYAKYLTFWKSEKDKGQYYAVDEGFKLTTGEIMSWINSDDLYHADSFKKTADAFLNNKNVEWITGKPNNTNELGKGIYSYEYLPVYTRNKFLKGLYWAPFIMQEGTFWKRSLWNKAGGYISTDYKLAADLELWVRFFRYAELYTVNSYLGCFRVRDGQRSSEQLIEYMTEAEKIIHEEKKSSCGQYCENKKTQQELIIKSEPALQFSLGEVNDFFLTCYFLSTFQKKNRFDLSLEYFNRVKDFYKKDFDKNKYPKITIVITSVNKRGSFEKSIISVITQAYPNLELIVVTKDAEKECQNVIEKYNEYINESINLSSENLSDFVKAGLQKTTGEIFFWLNDDHFLEPGVLLKLFKKFSTHENSTGWTSKFKIIDHGNNCELILDSNGVTLENISNNTYEKEIYLPFFILSTGFAKRIMKNEGLFDLNFWVNKIGTEKFLGFDEILVSRFVNEVEYNEANNENKVITNKRGMQMLQNEIENAIETGDYTKAIQLLQEVINNNPSDTEALNNLAVVLSILGEKDSAVRALNLVLQVDPQNEVALDNLKALAV